ncbi:unnamed protein product [Peronospora belbahrii]|nr:unnamed protein product [Peronospora belbahrii]
MATSPNKRRRVRQLVLEAAKTRANEVLTLKDNVCNQELLAPFSPSPIAVIDAVWTKLEAAQAALSSDDLLMDLGCGDGRWLISAVKRFGCNAMGVELNDKLVKKAQEQVQMENLQAQIQVVLGDVMLMDISNAKLVIVYAFAKSLTNIAERLKNQLKEDAKVLSIGFRIPTWKPHWSECEGGLRWYIYYLSDCIQSRSGSV